MLQLRQLGFDKLKVQSVDMKRSLKLTSACRGKGGRGRGGGEIRFTKKPSVFSYVSDVHQNHFQRF